MKNVVNYAFNNCPKLSHVIYISTAEQLLPYPFGCMLLSPRYLESKREAESFLLSARTKDEQKIARSIFRPGICHLNFVLINTCIQV